MSRKSKELKIFLFDEMVQKDNRLASALEEEGKKEGFKQEDIREVLNDLEQKGSITFAEQENPLHPDKHPEDVIVIQDDNVFRDFLR
ncbi:hypothetical protein [Bacillus sp. FJAT-44742]|uniref:hypothetical protein n=1 Tax=Bacillus sp. FJAT-44742 TaxID=2014005 RepID=UPI000C233C0F|nr:hypothetical protein [Bacillus sp. FJAT-44742]